MNDDKICSHHRQRHPDDVRFDRIEVRLVERWKASGISGDEWRFSTIIELHRRGRMLYRYESRDQDFALLHLARLPFLAPATFEDEGWEPVWREDGKGDPWGSRAEWRHCAQPGCKLQAVVRYPLLRHYDDTCSMSRPAEPGDFREFCRLHARRGDCALDDGTTNYGPGQRIADQASYVVDQEGMGDIRWVRISKRMDATAILESIDLSRQMLAKAGGEVTLNRHWLDGVPVPGGSPAEILDALERLVKPDPRPLEKRGKVCPSCGREAEIFKRTGVGGGVSGCEHCSHSPDMAGAAN